jgi:hypothetical protein
MEAVLNVLAASDPAAPPETQRSYREILKEGFESIDCHGSVSQASARESKKRLIVIRR